MDPMTGEWRALAGPDEDPDTEQDHDEARPAGPREWGWL